MTQKRPLVPGRHVLIITQVNPYTPVGGVTVVLQNLLSDFDPTSYTFAYLGRFDRRGRDVARPDIYRLIPNWHPVQFAGAIFKRVKHAFAVRRATRLARARNADIVVGLYPTLASLKIATAVARNVGARFFPYLHDTVVEGLSHTALGKDARKVQDDAFAAAEKILTMSEGMSDYYREAYGLESYPLVHSFPEQIATVPNYDRSRTAFWGGEVYAINDRSLGRVQKALLAVHTDLEVTSLSPLRGVDGANVRRHFYPTRREYIQAAQRHGLLVLAINWPDESDVHEAELSTIFPTKTVEYLATGSPILVHCPDYYFLARFFRRHQCGVVVSERNESALSEAIALLQSGSPSVREMQERALRVTDLFSISRVSATFEKYLTPTEEPALAPRTIVSAAANRA